MDRQTERWIGGQTDGLKRNTDKWIGYETDDREVIPMCQSAYTGKQIDNCETPESDYLHCSRSCPLCLYERKYEQNNQLVKNVKVSTKYQQRNQLLKP